MPEELRFVSLDKIDLPDIDVRRVRNPEYVEKLKESIRRHGIFQPILVRSKGDRYEVIAGTTRALIARELNLPQVPALVRNADARESAILRMLENLERENPDPVSEAAYITKLLVKTGMTPAELAKAINRSIDWVEARIAVAEMPDYMQEGLILREISLGVALELNKIDDEKIKRDWTFAARRDGMSVAGAKSAVNQYYSLKRAQEKAETPEEAPEIPSSPPQILFKCARCGEMMKPEESMLVRIHKHGCPIDGGTSSDAS